jgi:hypothetical protein
LADAAILQDVKADVFGYPDGPARTKIGAWGALWCAARWAAESYNSMCDMNLPSARSLVKAGSPVVVSDDAGEAVIGMLAVAGREAACDAYAIPVPWLVDMWPRSLPIGLFRPRHRWLASKGPG